MAHASEENVIQACFHDEPARVWDGSEQQIVESAWVSHVEATINQMSEEVAVTEQTVHEHSAPEQAEAELSREEEAVPEQADRDNEEDVYLLQFSRCPDEWRRMLLHGTPLKQCRLALHEAGHPCTLPSGAKVFVHPSQYQQIMANLNGMELRPHHVIVAQGLEYLVAESLAGVPRSSKVKLKSKSHINDMNGTATASEFSGSQSLPPGSRKQHTDVDSQVEANDGSECWDLLTGLVVKRTFLCTVRPLRNMDSVVQSTPHGTINPRRVIST